GGGGRVRGGHGRVMPRGGGRRRGSGGGDRRPRLQRRRSTSEREGEEGECPRRRRGPSAFRERPDRIRTGGREGPAKEAGGPRRLRGVHAPRDHLLHWAIPDAHHERSEE